jgi:hypothetical protein
MKTLDRMIEHLEEEVEGAREYAEKYIDCRAKGNIPRANKYKEMAQDELKHAGYIRDFAIADAEGIKRVHTLTEEEEHKWEHSHKKLNDEIAMIQHLLSM